MQEIEIQYKDKKSSSATIRDGKLILRISKNLPKQIQELHIRQLTQKLTKRFSPKQQHNEDLASSTCINPYGLGTYWLEVTNTNNNRTTIDFDVNKPIIKIKKSITLTPPELKQKLTDYISTKLEPLIKRYINELNSETVQEPNLKITLKNLQAKWGYCQYQKHTICLAKKLMWVPEEHVRYIIIHELCHFVHQNHSTAFWNEVKKYCPNYKKLDRDLLNWQ